MTCRKRKKDVRFLHGDLKDLVSARFRCSGEEVRQYLPVVSGVDQPGAVTSWGVKVWVVWRAEGTVEVPQPFSTSGNITVDLVPEVLFNKKNIRQAETVPSGFSLVHFSREENR